VQRQPLPLPLPQAPLLVVALMLLFAGGAVVVDLVVAVHNAA
jgi:hypothetical protein